MPMEPSTKSQVVLLPGSLQGFKPEAHCGLKEALSYVPFTCINCCALLATFGCYATSVASSVEAAYRLVCQSKVL